VVLQTRLCRIYRDDRDLIINSPKRTSVASCVQKASTILTRHKVQRGSPQLLNTNRAIPLGGAPHFRGWRIARLKEVGGYAGGSVSSWQGLSSRAGPGRGERRNVSHINDTAGLALKSW
jgi:hypothetical protein